LSIEQRKVLLPTGNSELSGNPGIPLWHSADRQATAIARLGAAFYSFNSEARQAARQFHPGAIPPTRK
jgi:hypothetical protein